MVDRFLRGSTSVLQQGRARWTGTSRPCTSKGVHFILEVQQRTFSFAESCRRYSISRARRIQVVDTVPRGGIRGTPRPLSDRPHHCPHAVAEGVRGTPRGSASALRVGITARSRVKLTAEKGSARHARSQDDRPHLGSVTTGSRRSADASGKPRHPGKPLTPMDEPNAKSGRSTSKARSRCSTAATAIPLPARGRFRADSCSSAEAPPHSARRSNSLVSLYPSKILREFRPPRCHPLRQRYALRFHRPRSPHTAQHVVDPSRYPSRATIEPGKPQQNGRHDTNA